MNMGKVYQLELEKQYGSVVFHVISKKIMLHTKILIDL